MPTDCAGSMDRSNPAAMAQAFKCSLFAVDTEASLQLPWTLDVPAVESTASIERGGDALRHPACCTADRWPQQRTHGLNALLTSLSGIFRLLLRCLQMALLFGYGHSTAMVVDDGASRISQALWPAVRIFHDPQKSMNWPEALIAAPSWAAPSGPTQNLGRREGAVWVVINIRFDGRSEADLAERVLTIDYPTLRHVELRHLHQQVVLHQQEISAETPFVQRQLPARSLAFRLQLRNGWNQIVLRIESETSIVLPVTLHTVAGFLWMESQAMAGLALLIGPMLFAGAYAIFEGMGRRDGVFLLYAVALAGNIAFLLAFTGVGTMLIWPSMPWISTWVAPFAVLLTVGAGTAFLRQMLPPAGLSAWPDRVLRQLPRLAVLAAAATLFGWVPHQHLQWFAALLGATSMGVVARAAWPGVRQRDPACLYLTASCAVYLAGSATTALMLAGVFPAHAATMHAYSVAMPLEMFIWLAALSLHARQLTLSAAKARQEIENSRTLAITDPLTGLPNRRGLQERLAAEMARQRVAGPEAGLVLYLMDIDGFKPVNDHYGHAAGDALLQALGPRLRPALPPSAMIARLGGDEFVVLLTDHRLAADADRFGQAMLDAVASDFHLDGCPHPVSIGLTIGYAVAPDDTTDPVQLMSLADHAMFEGKRSGRRQVRRARPAGPSDAGRTGHPGGA